MTDPRTALLLREYQEVNAHLRANTGQFVNWFSFFLIISFISAWMFAALPEFRPFLMRFAHRHGVQIVFLLMNVLSFVSILIFRRYILDAHQKICSIITQIDCATESPVPVRFSKWMTDLMTAGYVVSYFTWLVLLFVA